ncbi:MAG TPA: hypothetical protein VEO92_01615, partial [Candidatus Nitrosocosmicus sp.]|nr:hypothetical protein [Candidatus Nitrosocosmicus sp.]
QTACSKRLENETRRHSVYGDRGSKERRGKYGNGREPGRIIMYTSVLVTLLDSPNTSQYSPGV